MNTKTLISIAFALFSTAPLLYGSAAVEDIEELRKFYQLTQFKEAQTQPVTIAVLDNGFASLDFDNLANDPELPPKTNLTQSYPDVVSFALDALEEHGARVAKIIWAMAGKSPLISMELMNAHGNTNIVQALRKSIALKVDMIYCGLSLPSHNNFDGTGEIDELIADYIAQGGIFISPAGNFGKMVYEGKIETKDYTGKDGNPQPWILFKDSNGNLSPFLPFNNRLDENKITVTASWRYNESLGTDQDLDVYIFSEDGLNILGQSKKRQRIEPVEAGEETDATNISTESVSITLNKNLDNQNYLIAVRPLSGSFDKNRDTLRVVLEASKPDFPKKDGMLQPSAALINHTRNAEIMNIADSVGITVGDTSDHSSLGITRDGRQKPDVFLEKNSVRFDDNRNFAGSTIASAYFAGIVAVLKGVRPNLRQKNLLSQLQSIQSYPKLIPEITRVLTQADLDENSARGFIRRTIFAELQKEQGITTAYIASGGGSAEGGFGLDSFPLQWSRWKNLPQKLQNDWIYENPTQWVAFFAKPRPAVYEWVKDPDQTVTETVVVRPGRPGGNVRVPIGEKPIYSKEVFLELNLITGQMRPVKKVVDYETIYKTQYMPAVEPVTQQVERRIVGQMRKVEKPSQYDLEVFVFDQKNGEENYPWNKYPNRPELQLGENYVFFQIFRNPVAYQQLASGKKRLNKAVYWKPPTLAEMQW